MKKLAILCITLLALDFVQPAGSMAIPTFARKTGFNCMMCHTAFPRLNDFGQRYRDNGYQIPGQEGKEKNVFDLAPPVSMRLPLGGTISNNKEGTASSFNLYGFDLLAAGVLHKNISFLMIYTPRIDEPADLFSGPNNLISNPLQTGSLESVSLIFSNVIKNALNIRVGRFEPAYHVFSSKRSWYLFQPYEVYDFTTPANGYVFNDNQIGIEATGHFRSGFKYAAGIVNGNGASPDNNNHKDLYLNLTQTFGHGDGQTTGQRIGVFGYYGWQPLKLPGTVIGALGQTNGETNKSFYRVGATGGLNFKNLSLQAMYFLGADDKGFDSIAPVEAYRFNGGFVELNYAGLLNNRLIASAMYNWVQTPSGDPDRQINAFSALFRYYLGDWSAVNVSLHAEFTHRIMGRESKTSENIVALALDFAF